MLGGRAKEVLNSNSLPQVDNVQRDKYSSQIYMKTVQNAKLQPAQEKAYQNNVASLYA